jgi:hypothetical protein
MFVQVVQDLEGSQVVVSMQTVIIGVDPGLSGGLATLDGQGRMLDLRPMPESLGALIDYLRAVQASLKLAPLHVWLEAAQSFPKQGVSSAFNYGTHYGELRGILMALGVTHTLVRPGVWTKTMHAGTGAGPAKSRSLEAARRLLPGEAWRPEGGRGTKAHDGLVDAYLIAEYGRRQLAGAAAPSRMPA